jgi:hypothetical protein
MPPKQQRPTKTIIMSLPMVLVPFLLYLNLRVNTNVRNQFNVNAMFFSVLPRQVISSGFSL